MNSKYFAFEYYEDKEKLIKYIEKTMIKTAISPIHDKDINEDGTKKKPHYHILIEYDNVTTEKNIHKIYDEIATNKYIITVKSKQGYYDYLTHKNNKNKVKYKEEDITLLNGFKAEIQEEEKISLDITIINIIETQDITEFYKLVKVVKEINERELLKRLIERAFFYDKYMTSRRFSIDK